MVSSDDPHEDVSLMDWSTARSEGSTSGSEGDAPLRRDVRMLGVELGRAVKRLGGEALFGLIERIRELSKRRRNGDEQAERELQSLIASLDVEALEDVIHAFACFFDLANLSEDRHRVRVLRERQRRAYPEPEDESIGAAVEALKHQGLTASELRGLLDHLRIDLVFTAHPTEAKRRTVRRALRRLRTDLASLDRVDALQSERDAAMQRIRADLACLWDTETVRPMRPTVMQEVDRGLFVAEELWDVVPRICRQMRRALNKAYPDHDWNDLSFLRFGTWIGGDRDGNPYVTAEVTRQTLTKFRRAAIRLHLLEVEELTLRLSVSTQRRAATTPVDEAVQMARQRWPQVNAIVDRVSEHEVYRRWMRVIRFRLRQTAEIDFGSTTAPEGAYHDVEELRQDVRLIDEALRQTGHIELADDALRDWLDRMDVFGFHLAALDIRDNSQRFHETVDALMRVAGVCDGYMEHPDSRQGLLLQDVPDSAIENLRDAPLPDEAYETWQLFQTLHRSVSTFGRKSLGDLIISMTRSADDVLAVLWLWRLASRVVETPSKADIPIEPLFETIDDLKDAGGILDRMLQIDRYREHVEACGGSQTCMIGYSDSTKDGGYVTANWHLYEAQVGLTKIAQKHGVDLTFFHGRGGSLGRGGGPAARSILSLPEGSMVGRLRMTEQGEVLAERYDDPRIAQRHLEQVTWATMLVGADRGDHPQARWLELMAELSGRAYDAYRRLVESPGFGGYFAQATPIDVIESLPIGSRPSRRRGKRTIEDLRAIPYTFAWVQNRQMLTAFYGIGTAIAAMPAESLESMRQMYRQWRFFAAMIDNACLALAKCDPHIARCYTELAEDAEAREVGRAVDSEIELACRGVLSITGESQLLERTPWLRRSISVRNPYLDPLNLIQIELLKRRRASEATDDIDHVLRLSVQSIAAGMRTTG